MSEQWYKILHDKESCDTVMKIFHGFHDYMITRFDYDYPIVDPGVPWMSDSFLQITKDNTFLWYVDDVENPDDEIMNSHDLI